jgi:PAS domain S-box-containing protein
MTSPEVRTAFQVFYETAPAAILVLAPDRPRFTILAASDAYLRATKTSRDIIGRGIFDVFPDDPDDPASTGSPARASFERVLDTGAPDTMAVQKHSIRRSAAEGGGFEERYWSPVNTPVLGPGGEVLYVHHRVEDVTEFVRHKQNSAEHRAIADMLRTRAGDMESDVLRRAQELQEVNRQLRAANERLAELDRERDRCAEERVREGTALLRAISDTSADVIFAKDRAGRIRFGNPAFLAIVGRPLDEVIGRTDAEFFHDAAARELMESDRQVMETGTAQEMEERVPLADGTERIWSSRKTPYRDDSGAVVGLLGVSRDITERKRAEEALRENEERFRLLVQGVKDCAIYMLAPDGTVKSWSASAEQLFGYREEEIVGQSRALFFTEEDRRAGAPQRGLDEAAAHGRCEEEAWRVRMDGSRFWSNVQITALRDDAGNLRGFASVNRDFTERKKAETTLRESDDRLRMAHEAARVGSFEWDPLSGVNTWTPQLEAMYGLPPGGFAKTEGAWESLVHPDDRAEAVRRVTQAFETSAPSEAEWRVVWPDGSVHWISGRWQVLNDASGKKRMTGINIDVTERKRAEELRASEAALREADRQKNQFLAVLSHELRNPLAPIRNSLYILERAAAGGEQGRRAQAVIDRQVGQLTLLIDDLLDVTRIAHGKVRLQRERLDLNELAQHTAEDHRSLYGRSDVRLEVLPAPAEVWVQGDRARLVQVIGNLLQNAVKFTPQGGKTTLSVLSDPARGQTTLTVRDTGAGIEPEMLPRLFQTFAQADATLDRSKGGLGLGLALVKGLVEMHGGTVSAASGGHGKGAAFTIRLPLDLARTVAPQTALPQRSALAGAAARVLVVEDNEDAAETLREALELDQHTVEVAYNGREGIEKARVFHPDVVLCDIGLPGMDGYEVARTMRADPELRWIGLIAVSGYAQPEDVATAKAAGFDAHLAKPPSIESLERTLAEVGAPVCALRRGRVPADLVGSDRHLRGASGQAVGRSRSSGHHQVAEDGVEPLAAAGCPAGAAGRATRSVVPPVLELSTSMSPPSASTMFRQMESPRPVPTPCGFVVKNGSKMRSATSGGIPAPVSCTASTARPRASVPVETRISFASAFPSGMAWAALMSRFSATCPSRASSAITAGVGRKSRTRRARNRSWVEARWMAASRTDASSTRVRRSSRSPEKVRRSRTTCRTRSAPSRASARARSTSSRSAGAPSSSRCSRR